MQLVDLKVGPTGDDCMMLDWLGESGIPYCVVATKADKLTKTERAENISALMSHPLLSPPEASETIRVIPFSSVTGEGRDDVIKVIADNAYRFNQRTA